MTDAESSEKTRAESPAYPSDQGAVSTDDSSYGSSAPYRDYGRTYGANQDYPSSASTSSLPFLSASDDTRAVFGLREQLGFGVVGFVLVVIGMALLAVSYWIGDWGGGQTFRNVQSQTAHASGVPTLTDIYFGWLVWVVLGAVTIVSVLAVIPMGSITTVLRTVGCLAGLAAGVVTAWAVKGDTGWRTALSHTPAGVWMAGVGFLLCAIGALVGPRRVGYTLA